MSSPRRFPLTIGLLWAVLPGGAARAEDNMLRGPHPFRKDNELSAHVLLAVGGGGTPSGTKIGADYGYKLWAPAWLNLELNYQHSSCRSPSGGSTCTEPTGTIFETLAGLKLKWPTAIPVVPFGKAAAGLAYQFPDGAADGWGVAARLGAGANYFFFDWLGLGVELGCSFGHLSTRPPGYAVLDFGGGLEFQF
jgi:hypothetical protein